MREERGNPVAFAQANPSVSSCLSELFPTLGRVHLCRHLISFFLNSRIRGGLLILAPESESLLSQGESSVKVCDHLSGSYSILPDFVTHLNWICHYECFK